MCVCSGDGEVPHQPIAPLVDGVGEGTHTLLYIYSTFTPFVFQDVRYEFVECPCFFLTGPVSHIKGGVQAEGKHSHYCSQDTHIKM